MPRVALQTRGNISLNQAAYKALGEPVAVLLMFDKTSNAVGLQPASLDAKHVYPIRKQPNSKSYMIGAVAFCKHYEIDVSHTRAFSPQVEDGVLVFDLDKGTDLPARKRRSRTQGIG
jgi:hypothetical protein